MLFFIKYLIECVYALAICGIATYGCHRIALLICWYLESKKRVSASFSSYELGDLPFVTVQLPLFNERFVAARLITAAAMLDWPQERLGIQVLDDSTDETIDIVDKEARRWENSGIAIKVVRRGNRAGFKAGALSAGMQRAKGHFFAIFDADFIPDPAFLRRTMPHFGNPRIGMVQARWGFLNANHSWLTRVQAILIGPHFGIEHFVRHRRGLFFNFNGTAGVWRRSAIETAGGWQADTVTEDLDLSYRAQMAGWRFIYLNDLVAPSELPVTLSAFRTQQQRWAKGSIQTARKILPELVRSSQPSVVKFEACAHLLANLGWVAGALVTLLTYPFILSRVDIGLLQLLRFDIPLMGLGIGAILLYFFCYAVSKSDLQSIVWLPLVPMISIGIAPAIAVAVVQGMFVNGGRFQRTPKFGLIDQSVLPATASAYFRRSSLYFLCDIIFVLYTLLPIHFAWQHETWLAMPFLAIFPAGFILAAISEFANFRGAKQSSLI